MLLIFVDHFFFFTQSRKTAFDEHYLFIFLYDGEGVYFKGCLCEEDRGTRPFLFPN